VAENGTSREDFVRVQLDRERILRFDTNAICDFEEVAGKSVLEAVYGPTGVLTIADIRNLLWAGLRHEDDRLSRPRMGHLIEAFLMDGGRMQTLADAIASAVERSRLFQALREARDPNSPREPKSSQTSASGSANA